MNQTAPHILLDIEALGLVPGSEIIELGAIAFDPDTVRIISEFSSQITPYGKPFHVDLDTLNWHHKGGTYPREHEGANPLTEVMEKFNVWISGLYYSPAAYWSWGSTYDFPLLDFAFVAVGLDAPWEYYQCQCARTVWNLAYPGKKHAPRPHLALEDCRAALTDLISAVQHLSKS